MLLTSFRIRKIENSTNRLVAKCTITFDAMFAVSDIKILTKDSGDYYLGMPSRKTAVGTFKDEAYPVNSDVRKALERVLFGAIDKALELDSTIVDGEVIPGHGKISLLQQSADDFAFKSELN